MAAAPRSIAAVARMRRQALRAIQIRRSLCRIEQSGLRACSDLVDYTSCNRGALSDKESRQASLAWGENVAGTLLRIKGGGGRPWIEPELCRLVEKAPSGPRWIHEIKFDGYRMGARIDHGRVTLLTRSGLDWTDKYPDTAAALSELPVENAYIDGELCGVRPDGVTSFSLIQTASDSGTGSLVYFAFDLLFLDGEAIGFLPLGERKARLEKILKSPPHGIAYSEHDTADGERLRKAACEHSLEGLVSKMIDRPYKPGERGTWVKSKCLNRSKFIIVGWTDPEGARVLIGSLLIGYYDAIGRLLYAGRVGTGMSQKTLPLQICHWTRNRRARAVSDRRLSFRAFTGSSQNWWLR